jgi:ABC-type sugar transport system ATPase subunit
MSKRARCYALVGENGAGKSTLIKILAGIYRADCGEVVLDGCKITCKTPNDSQQAGISVVHQELKLAEPLSVMETFFWETISIREKRHNRLENDAQKNKGNDSELGIPMDIDAPVCELTIAKKQIVEISKAINRQCKIIVMDEPSPR